MSHLLPHFNCLPHTFSSCSKSHLHSPTLISTNSWHIYSQKPCILSETSPQTSTATTVLDTEKLQLTSLEARSNLAATDIRCTCAGAIGSPTETNFGAVLAKETLLTGEEAITHVTAAEAAANVSEDSRMMFGHYSSSKLDGRLAILPSEPDTTELAETGLDGVEVSSTLARNGLGENCFHSEEADDSEQILNELAVRSRRETEREARRHKAAEKASEKHAHVQSVFTTPKRRASLLQADLYNPLAFLDGLTSKSRFLTRAEEHKLSEGVKVLRKIEKHREELGRGATFAEWAAAAGMDEKTLKYRLDHGLRCKDKIIRSNIGLVVSIAKYYQGPEMDLKEMVQVGCQGIVKAAEKFDSRRARFTTYATWWIKLAIRKEFIIQRSSSLRLPVRLVEELRKTNEAKNRLYSKNGMPPSEEQIAKEARLSMKRLQFLRLLPEVKSVDTEWLNDNFEYRSYPPFMYCEDYEKSDIDPYGTCSPEERTRRVRLKEDMEKVLDTLKPRDKQIIKLRFGMESGVRPMTLQAIGDRLDLTKERVRQIVLSSLKQIREYIDYESWKWYL